MLAIIVVVAVVLAACGGAGTPAALTPEREELRAIAVALALAEDGLGDGEARVSDITGLLTTYEVELGARSKAIVRTPHVAMFVDVFDSVEAAAAVYETHVEECPECLMALCGPVFIVARTQEGGAAAAGDVEEAQRLLEGRHAPC